MNPEKRRLLDGMDVVQERDDDNDVTVTYTRDGNIGGILSRRSGSTSYYFHYDGSGNVIGMTDSSQNSVAEYAYDAYGNLLSSSGSQASNNNYRYSTKEHFGSIGLYNYGYRFYSPGFGRWINRDPLEEAGGLNVYGFGPNSPINGYDEYGLDWIDDGSNFFGGWGDTLTFGGTRYVRVWMGTDGFVDQCSGWYAGGEFVGDIHQRLLTRGRGKGALQGPKALLRRPYIRKRVREEVNRRAPRMPDGRPINPNTRKPIDGTPDLGHKRGYEFWREKQRAEAEGLPQRAFNDRMNNPDKYQLEDPSSNRSHRYEAPR